MMEFLNRLYRILRSTIQIDSDRSYQKNYKTDFGSEFKSSKTQENIDDKLAGYYANLEIPYGADLKTATKAWKKLLRKYHPDLHSKDPEKVKTANDLVQGLNKAYAEIKKSMSKS
jgi:DnaJ-class molecular chaperone